jgi:hypothetical protein
MLSMSLAVVLLGTAAGAAALLAAASAVPVAAAPPAGLSGSLKSFTAAYSSRILQAILARWLRKGRAHVGERGRFCRSAGEESDCWQP